MAAIVLGCGGEGGRTNGFPFIGHRCKRPTATSCRSRSTRARWTGQPAEGHTRIRADPADGVFFEAEFGCDLSERCAPRGFKYNLLATRGGHSVVAERIATAHIQTRASTGSVNSADADTELAVPSRAQPPMPISARGAIPIDGDRRDANQRLCLSALPAQAGFTVSRRAKAAFRAPKPVSPPQKVLLVYCHPDFSRDQALRRARRRAFSLRDIREIARFPWSPNGSGEQRLFRLTVGES